MNDADQDYLNELLAHIADLNFQIDMLREENAGLHRENRSWRMWMDRSISRLQEMQV